MRRRSDAALSTVRGIPNPRAERRLWRPRLLSVAGPATVPPGLTSDAAHSLAQRGVAAMTEKLKRRPKVVPHRAGWATVRCRGCPATVRAYLEIGEAAPAFVCLDCLRRRVRGVSEFV